MVTDKCFSCNVQLGSLHKTGLCATCRNIKCNHCGEINKWKKVQKRNCKFCEKVLDAKFRSYTRYTTIAIGVSGNDNNISNN